MCTPHLATMLKQNSQIQDLKESLDTLMTGHLFTISVLKPVDR